MKKIKCWNSKRLFVSKNLIFAGFATLLITACSEETEESDTNSVVSDIIVTDNDQDHLIEIDKTQKSFESAGDYSFQTTFDSQKGWGYQLLDSGKVFINQPHIPAVSGNEGFSSEEKAITCAEFALSKVQLGMIPPTLTKDELDSLGVLD